MAKTPRAAAKVMKEILKPQSKRKLASINARALPVARTFFQEKISLTPMNRHPQQGGVDLADTSGAEFIFRGTPMDDQI